MKYRLLSSIHYSDKDKYEEIYMSRFNSESTCKFDFEIFNNQAFVVINSNILKVIEDIMEQDKLLSELISDLPNIAIQRYTKRCLIDEIRITNKIEGIHSTRKEISDVIDSSEKKRLSKRLYGLIRKYEMLMDYEDVSLNSCEDLRDLYDELVLKEVMDDDPKNKPDGVLFRKDRVYVESPTRKKIHSGVYPEENIIKDISKSLNILNNESYSFFIRVAVFHYLFGYIHPFYDGNGRMSRFISSYLLSRRLEFLVSYRLSYTVNKNINAYYKMFKVANDPKNKGDLTNFVINFLGIVLESMEDLCESLNEKYVKLEYYWSLLNQKFADDNDKIQIAYILVQNALFGESGLSILDIYNISDSGESKVRSILKELKKENIAHISKDGNKHLYELDLEELEEV